MMPKRSKQLQNLSENYEKVKSCIHISLIKMLVGFHLTKSPKRGAFYERLNRDLKSIVFQKLGRSYLPFDGLYRVVKDAEIIFNNRPLQYVEDKVGPRVLTNRHSLFMKERFTYLKKTKWRKLPAKWKKIEESKG